jgi:predicted PurR-regulated permease PerM
MLSSRIKKHPFISFVLGIALTLGGGKIGGAVGILISIVGMGIIIINRIDGYKQLLDAFHERKNRK